MSWKRFLERKRLDEDFTEELEAHLAHEVDRSVEDGMSPEEARWAALRRFGT